jgi:uncharacterized protein (UPF0264 family)
MRFGAPRRDGIGLLVSVRDVPEALVAAEAGADFIDLKDPAAGALGGLAPALIADILAALRAAHPALPVSATIGDFAPDRADEILRRVAAVQASGVTYVKVGIEPGAQALALLQRLAGGRSASAVIPVFIADGGVDRALWAAALDLRRFPALMLDTADKHGGSLLQKVPAAALADCVRAARAHGVGAGLAGALRLADLPALAGLAPDFAGFRSAVCEGGRAQGLSRRLTHALRAALAAASG